MNHTDEDALHRIMAELRRAPRRRARDLHCPFPPAVHADVEVILDRSIAWAREVGLCGSPAAERRLRGAAIGRLPARAYPWGARPMVQLAADWTTLFCLLDDHIERLEGPAAVTACLTELADILRGGGEPGGDPMKRACADLHARLVAAAPPGWMARFDIRVRQLFDAFSWEAAVRRAGAIPAMDVYLPMREVTVGLHVEFEIGELACGAELGPRARNHPAIVALARRASNIVGWANDIYTYEREISQGEGTNLVAVLACERGMSLGRALASAIAMHDAEVRSFIALSSDLPSIGAGEDEGVHGYVAMLRCWVRGHLDWGTETGRYDPGLAAARERLPDVTRASVGGLAAEQGAH
jgi:hypothetical protein